jgi:hypothetical protein
MVMTENTIKKAKDSSPHSGSHSDQLSRSHRTLFVQGLCNSIQGLTSDETRRVIWLILVQERLLLAQEARPGYISAYINRPLTTFEALRDAFRDI